MRSASLRKRRIGRRYFPLLFYVLLGLFNLAILLVFGGTSFRADAQRIWSSIVPGEIDSGNTTGREVKRGGDQFPPGENWYSGSEDIQGQPLTGAPPHPAGRP